MRVILADDVVGVGDIGESVKVKPGYARNFLIPRGLAIEVGSSSAKEINHKKKQIEVRKERLKVDAESLAEKLSELDVPVGLRVGSSGKVFGSISSRDIARKLSELGFEIDRRRVMQEDPIRKLGVHFVRVKLHPDVYAQVKVVVEKLEATEEEEQQEAVATRRIIEDKVEAKREEAQSEQQESDT